MMKNIKKSKKSTEKDERGLKLTKKVENGSEKVVWPAFWFAKHPKAGPNIQQITL